ncbi:hypothetical protein [Aquabacterium sp.]|uniref:hypothetical protein n=1 Tax=Aquabacterium sp. TaxID=1872578 RepID=UPI0025BFB7C6|nr:hypothetical protein [Aquabacterium sp.]
MDTNTNEKHLQIGATVAELIDIIKGALVDDVRQYHAPEWIARAEKAVLDAPQRYVQASAPSVTVDTPEFQQLIEYWRNEPYGTRSFENAWSELIAHIDAHTAAVAAKAVVQAYQNGFDAGKAYEALDRVSTPQQHAQAALSDAAVGWIVNDNAELGVKIGNQFFFLYKGRSLVYEPAQHDDGSPLMWRPVGKREFGECCHPVNYADPTKIGTVRLDDGNEWKEVAARRPPAAAPATKQTDLAKRLLFKANDTDGTQISIMKADLIAICCEANRYYDGMVNWKSCAEAKDAALASQASKGAGVDLNALQDIAEELQLEAQQYTGDFADTVNGCADAIIALIAQYQSAKMQFCACQPGERCIPGCDEVAPSPAQAQPVADAAQGQVVVGAGNLPLFDRKLADLEQRGYEVIGRILHKEGQYALFDSSCRWLTKPQYQRLMHEQDGSLFADKQPAADAGQLPTFSGCLASRLYEAIDIARERAQHAGSVQRRKKWEATAKDLSAALAARQPAVGAGDQDNGSDALGKAIHDLAQVHDGVVRATGKDGHIALHLERIHTALLEVWRPRHRATMQAAQKGGAA